MRKFLLAILILILPVASAFAQTPSLQMNVVYVCTDGQSFKVFSCSDATGACDYQNYKKGQAFQRGEALRVQLIALLPAKCHAQTAAERRLPLIAARFRRRLLRLRRARLPAATGLEPQRRIKAGPVRADSR